VCGEDCSFDGKCPANYVCSNATSAETGATRKQCLPASGSCECGGSAADGGNVDNDPDNCGSCGNKCTVKNGTAGCVKGKCTIASCNPGWADCSMTYANGCDTQTNTTTNCGTCGNACPAATTCTGGQCVCAGGGVSCKGVCVNTSTDPSNCGSCGNVCPSGTSCVGGKCQCPTGETACGSACVDTSTNPNNCGGCGKACGTGATCSGGQCQCSTGTMLCGSACVDTSTDPANCGSCGNACPTGATCAAGKCVSCSANGDKMCSGVCVNTNTDPNNCGGCGVACSNPHGTTSCSGGVCVPVCSAGYADCNGTPNSGCTTSLNSVGNCGACGTACVNSNGTTSCPAGVCQPVCSAGWGDCNGNPNDGCTTQLNSITNCGACGAVCSTPNATPTCATGTCAIGSCDPGWANCDGIVSNGCETQLNGPAPTCGNVIDMGSVSGDSGNQFTAVFTGHGEQMFHLRVNQTPGSCVYVSASFELISPPGIEYDLYAAFSCGACTSNSQCTSTQICADGNCADGASTGNGAGQIAGINSCECGSSCDGSNGYDVWLWVAYNSGTGCGTWSLQAEGDTDDPTCDNGC
jgi:hypothetical protein